MIGDKIRQLIESQGVVNKKEVAEKIKTSETNLHLLMKKESVETKYLEALGEIFNVPVSYFFEEKQVNTHTSKRVTAESKQFSSDVIELLKEQLRQKDEQILKLIEKVGKFRGVIHAAVLLVFFWSKLTKRITPII